MLKGSYDHKNFRRTLKCSRTFNKEWCLSHHLFYSKLVKMQTLIQCLSSTALFYFDLVCVSYNPRAACLGAMTRLCVGLKFSLLAQNDPRIWGTNLWQTLLSESAVDIQPQQFSTDHGDVYPTVRQVASHPSSWSRRVTLSSCHLAARAAPKKKENNKHIEYRSALPSASDVSKLNICHRPRGECCVLFHPNGHLSTARPIPTFVSMESRANDTNRSPGKAGKSWLLETEHWDQQTLQSDQHKPKTGLSLNCCNQ